MLRVINSTPMQAGVSIVISSLGIGKLATIVTGFLSDRFGRKPFIYLFPTVPEDGPC
jgi:MFS family permease